MPIPHPIIATSSTTAWMAGSATARRIRTETNIRNGFITRKAYQRSFSDPVMGLSAQHIQSKKQIKRTANIARDRVFSNKYATTQIPGDLRIAIAETSANARLRMDGARYLAEARLAAHGVPTRGIGVAAIGGLGVVGVGAGTEAALKYRKTHMNKGNHRFASKTPTAKMHGRRNVRTRRDSHGRYAGSY